MWSLLLRKNWWKFVLCQEAPEIFDPFFIKVTRLWRRFSRINKHSSINKLQLGFVNDFIAPIILRSFTTLKVIHLRKSMSDVVDLKCCSKWSANESDFCPFLRRVWPSDKWMSILFLNVWCVLPIQIASHLEYFTS